MGFNSLSSPFCVAIEVDEDDRLAYDVRKPQNKIRGFVGFNSLLSPFYVAVEVDEGDRLAYDVNFAV